MRNLLDRLENRIVREYGFESKTTIFIFRITEFLRKGLTNR